MVKPRLCEIAGGMNYPTDIRSQVMETKRVGRPRKFRVLVDHTPSREDLAIHRAYARARRMASPGCEILITLRDCARLRGRACEVTCWYEVGEMRIVPRGPGPLDIDNAVVVHRMLAAAFRNDGSEEDCFNVRFAALRSSCASSATTSARGTYGRVADETISPTTTFRPVRVLSPKAIEASISSQAENVAIVFPEGARRCGAEGPVHGAAVHPIN